MKEDSRSTPETVTQSSNDAGFLRWRETMKKCLNLAAVLFLVGMCAAPVWAQMEGAIRGVCKDQEGKPMNGATVIVQDAQTGRKYTLKCNNGEYFSIGINIGTYKATLMVNGNPVDEHNNIPIGAGQEQRVDFDLLKERGSGLTEEQKAKIAAAQKENDKIKNLNATLKQAKELEGQGNFEQAVTILQQASQIDPNQDLVWAYLGDAQRGTKKYTDAIESYQKALALKPNNGPYMAGMADAMAKSGQTDKAVETYAAAAAADPTNAGSYYYNEGAVLTNTGKVDEAIAAFDKAIQIDPNRADAYYWKGIDMMGKATTGKDGKMSAPPGTSEAFNKYLELQPTGKYAQASKDMLSSIGASVQTNYGKGKAPKK
jgi:tetratricopeptide (TPR) repeat protein